MSIDKSTRGTIAFLEDLAGGPLTFGRLMLAIREGEALSQAKFAKMLGVSRQNLCHIEHGRRSISPKIAAAFAKKLGYSEQLFVRLVLQDALARDGLHFIVELKAAA